MTTPHTPLSAERLQEIEKLANSVKSYRGFTRRLSDAVLDLLADATARTQENDEHVRVRAVLQGACVQYEDDIRKLQETLAARAGCSPRAARQVGRRHDDDAQYDTATY